jgi:hypothetical protein
MTTKITTTLPIGSLLDLQYEWKVIAFRDNGEGEWRWNIEPMEVRTFKQMVEEGHIVSVHRRDSDGTRLLARLRSKRK